MQFKTDTQNEKNGGYTIALFSHPLVWGSTKGRGGAKVHIAVHFRLVKVTYGSGIEVIGETVLDPELLNDRQKLRIFNYCKKLAEEHARKKGLKIISEKKAPSNYPFSNRKGKMIIGKRVTWCLINVAKK